MSRLLFFTASLFLGFSFMSCSTVSKGKMGPDYRVLGVSYIDSTGLYWLEKLDEDFKNGCLDKEGTYHSALCSKAIENSLDSDAEAKCETYGARLPTMGEYQRLLKDFQPSADLEKGLSDDTYHDVAMAFKDDMPYAAWTSTVNPGNSAQARFFSWKKGGVSKRFEYRSVDLPVRCVRKP